MSVTVTREQYDLLVGAKSDLTPFDVELIHPSGDKFTGPVTVGAVHVTRAIKDGFSWPVPPAAAEPEPVSSPPAKPLSALPVLEPDPDPDIPPWRPEKIEAPLPAEVGKPTKKVRGVK